MKQNDLLILLGVAAAAYFLLNKKKKPVIIVHDLDKGEFINDSTKFKDAPPNPPADFIDYTLPYMTPRKSNSKTIQTKFSNKVTGFMVSGINQC